MYRKLLMLYANEVIDLNAKAITAIALASVVIFDAHMFVNVSNGIKMNNTEMQHVVHDASIIVEDKAATNVEVHYDEYAAPKNSGFKSYMDYRMITNKDSKQYGIQEYYATTGNHGIRMVGDRCCVAIGSYFNVEVGQLFDIVLENGTVIPCVVADMKADVDTESTNMITSHNGCMSEFVVDTQSLDKNARLRGDISYCQDDWISPIASILVYDNNIFDFD